MAHSMSSFQAPRKRQIDSNVVHVKNHYPDIREFCLFDNARLACFFGNYPPVKF